MDTSPFRPIWISPHFSLLILRIKTQKRIQRKIRGLVPIACGPRLPHPRGMTAPLRTDLNDFLFARIADDAKGMHVTVLSVLARSGVDPWDEAAELAELSRESATQKLVSVLANVPNGPLPGADTATTASRLVALLHPVARPRVATAGATLSRAAVAAQPTRVKLAIYYLLALIFVVAGSWALINLHEPSATDTSQSTSP